MRLFTSRIFGITTFLQPRSPMSSDSPNVIVFLTDQQRWDSCGIHDNPLGLTPNYDRFARGGTHAAHAFTCQPVCTPARSCIQTGLYATQSGCWRNGIALPKDARTIAQEFADAGYRTGYIGKWHLGDDDVIGPVPADRRGGYQDWLAANVLEMTSDAYDCRVYDNDDEEVKLPGYRVDALADAAIRYIDDHGDETQPFFLFVSLLEPHHQNHRDDYPAPMGTAQQYVGRWIPPDLASLGGNAPQSLPGYLGMIKRIDDAFGRILDAVESLSLTDNTVIAYTSDHGCHFRTRNDEYKRSCHESSIRIPMALGGGPFRSGGELSQLVSLVDLPPTLLAAAGVEVPSAMQGHSILPLLHGQNADWSDDVFVQISESEIGRAVRTKRWKYSVRALGADGSSAPHAGRYVEQFLYDLAADPWELTNLVGSVAHREVCDRLRERLLQRMAAAGEAPVIIDPAPPIEFEQRRVSPVEIEA